MQCVDGENGDEVTLPAYQRYYIALLLEDSSAQECDAMSPGSQRGAEEFLSSSRCSLTHSRFAS